MPSPRRRPPLYVPGDLSPDALDELPWPQLTALAAKGLITWAETNYSLQRRARRLGDPYAHLREER